MAKSVLQNTKFGDSVIVYLIPDSEQRLVFTLDVLNHFKKHRQNTSRKYEAGGQLFARFNLTDIVIVEATGPRRRDQRTRFSYRPHRPSEQKEIDSRHKRGLIYIGDWHTHPEGIPHPSNIDRSSMQDIFSKSVHKLNVFVLVVVGTREVPDGLSVLICNDVSVASLRPEST